MCRAELLLNSQNTLIINVHKIGTINTVAVSIVVHSKIQLRHFEKSNFAQFDICSVATTYAYVT
jgi:hypothetical protein